MTMEPVTSKPAATSVTMNVCAELTEGVRNVDIVGAMKKELSKADLSEKFNGTASNRVIKETIENYGTLSTEVSVNPTTITPPVSTEPSLKTEFLTKEEPAMKQPEQVKQQMKKQKRPAGQSKMLADLLAVEAWHNNLHLGAGKARQSAQKIQQIREEQLFKRLEQEDQQQREVELTPEELAELERKKQEKKLRIKLAAEERKRKKELAIAERKRKAEEKRRLIAEGIIKVEPKVKKDNFYSGTEAEKLMKAASYFVNIGTKFDETLKRESKPPQRMMDEITEARKSANKGKRLKQLGTSKTVKKRKHIFDNEQEAKRIKKKSAKKKSHSEETEEKESIIETLPESHTEPEPEPIWFTDIEANDYIEITDDWKYFEDFIYKGAKDTGILTGLSSAQSFVTSNIKQYQIQHPVFKNILTQLHYPFSNYQEKYLLSLPKVDVYFNPFDEIGKMMEIISSCFLPYLEKNKVINIEDPDNCIVGRYIKAFETTDLDSLLKCITEFNTLVDATRNNGSIFEHTKNQKKVPRLAVYELLNQCYTRSVLPQAKKLSNYKAFSNEVYGELMPTFLTTVYKECGLNHKSVFIDLGSGVGNCVIQAALEFGCESYGVEIVENASHLADLQLVEFQNRCRAFGFKPGYVKLFGNQSFAENPPVQAVIDKCDVMLVNNYLFDAKLNKKVVDLLETCKVGTKIISLKPVVPATHKTTNYNIDSVLNRMKTTKYIYGENSVSWTSKGGFYYITEVMDVIQQEHLEQTSRSRRQIALESRSRSDTPLNAFTNNC